MGKLTDSVKAEIRDMYVRGVQSPDGTIKLPTIAELADAHDVNESTLYRHSHADNWKVEREQFQGRLTQEKDDRRRAELVEAAVEFDRTSLVMARSIMAPAGGVMRRLGRGGDDGITPAQLSHISSAVTNAQRIGKLALGEATDNMSLNANVTDTSEAFERAMELLDAVADARREGSGQSIH